MKEYMTLSIGAMGLVGGWTGQKIISNNYYFKKYVKLTYIINNVES